VIKSTRILFIMPIISEKCPRGRYAKDQVVFTAGCFDLFHAGHLNLLMGAKLLGGQLNVAVLADDYVRKYKGRTRPINREEERLLIVQSIRFVDSAWIARSSPNSNASIAILRPRAIVFGIGCTQEEQLKNEARTTRILSAFPEIDIHLFSRHVPDELSTTLIIGKIREVPDQSVVQPALSNGGFL
jgi:cytidyltransferase-like protein